MAEVTITLKGGPGFDAPWIVIKGESVAEVSGLAEELRTLGAFSAVRLMATEFCQAPAAGTETVQAAIPGSTDITGTPAGLATVEQFLPLCETCGAETRPAHGNGANGEWHALRCVSGDKSHTKYL